MSPLSAHTEAHTPFFQRVWYRVSQFWRGLTASIAAQERSLVSTILTPEAEALFQRMPVDAQRHSLDVLVAVRSQGARDSDLDAAALLHDVGKVASTEGGPNLGLWLRGPLVLLDAVAPNALAKMARPEPESGWRYTAYVHREHPRIGSEWAASAGCSERTCWFIRHHQDNAATLTHAAIDGYDRRMLAVLQAADAKS